MNKLKLLIVEGNTKEENINFNLNKITGSNGEVYLGRIYEPSR